MEFDKPTIILLGLIAGGSILLVVSGIAGWLCSYRIGEVDWHSNQSKAHQVKHEQNRRRRSIGSALAWTCILVLVAGFAFVPTDVMNAWAWFGLTALYIVIFAITGSIRRQHFSNLQRLQN